MLKFLLPLRIVINHNFNKNKFNKKLKKENTIIKYAWSYRTSVRVMSILCLEV